MSLSIDGPKTRYKDRPADWIIKVSNPSDVPMGNVVVRDKLPRELQFVSASQGGQLIAGEVVWNLGNLNPREERSLQITAQSLELTPAAVQNVTATADPGLRKDVQAALKIFGRRRALRTQEIVHQGDPAPVGNKVTYILKIANLGTLEATDIAVLARIPRHADEILEPPTPNQKQCGRAVGHLPESAEAGTEQDRGVHDRGGELYGRATCVSTWKSAAPSWKPARSSRNKASPHLQSGSAAAGSGAGLWSNRPRPPPAPLPGPPGL